VTVIRSKKRNTSVIVVMNFARTDERGDFSIEVTQDGESEIVVWEPDIPLVHRALGTLQDNCQDIQLLSEKPTSVGGIRFHSRQTSFPGHTLRVTDFTFPVEQPSLELLIDRYGLVMDAPFRRGREYSVGVVGPNCPDGRGKFFRWEGERDIDLDSLPLTTAVLTARDR
jgi:hypothetical protein